MHDNFGLFLWNTLYNNSLFLPLCYVSDVPQVELSGNDWGSRGQAAGESNSKLYMKASYMSKKCNNAIKIYTGMEYILKRFPSCILHVIEISFPFTLFL